MIQFTNQQKDVLKEIMENKYAAGPFTGMVFNAAMTKITPRMNSDSRNDIIRECLGIALITKIICEEMK